MGSFPPDKDMMTIHMKGSGRKVGRTLGRVPYWFIRVIKNPVSQPDFQQSSCLALRAQGTFFAHAANQTTECVSAHQVAYSGHGSL